MPPVWLSCVALLFAHNPDTSYARIKISQREVQTRLTYDVFTLLKVAALDDNADNRLSRAELAAHAPQIAGYLRDRIGLAVSDEDETADLGQFAEFVWPPDVGEAIAAADYHSAIGLIHFDFVRPLDHPPEVVAIAFGFFEQFSDRHTVLGVFECRGDKYETSFTNYEDYFEYATGFTPAMPQTRHTLAERFWRFFKMGVEHIFLGYDHICFLIALIVVSKFREIVKIVTSFTVAHSITLILATLDVVRLPTRLVETCIAATIVYVALENLWLVRVRNAEFGMRSGGDRDTSIPHSALHRWRLTFFFGLIHGFGFANVLRELELPTVGLIRCLLAFNIGVEVGQLAIAIVLLPFALLLARWKHGPKVVVAISLLLALFGTAWFLDRAFTLEFMPF